MEDAADTRPILIVPYMWIGDFVRGHTVVRVLKQRWPNRPVDLLVTSLCAPLVDYMPGVRAGSFLAASMMLRINTRRQHALGVVGSTISARGELRTNDIYEIRSTSGARLALSSESARSIWVENVGRRNAPCVVGRLVFGNQHGLDQASPWSCLSFAPASSSSIKPDGNGSARQ